MKKVIPPDHWLRVKPIAHRGLHDGKSGIPENSLKAFEEACKKGFPIELDVRVTSDGKPAVFYDISLTRMTGVNKWISAISSKSIRNIKLLNSQEHIPLLSEVLEHVNGRVPILIEIKRNLLPGILESAVVNALRNYHGEFAILSFNPVALRFIHNIAPEYISGINIGKAEKFFFEIDVFNKFINNFSFPHFISYSMNGRVPTESVSYYKNLNLPILAWTVTSENEAKAAKIFAENIIFEKYIPQ